MHNQKEKKTKIPTGWAVVGSAVGLAAFGIGVGLGYAGVTKLADDLADKVVKGFK